MIRLGKAISNILAVCSPQLIAIMNISKGGSNGQDAECVEGGMVRTVASRVRDEGQFDVDYGICGAPTW